jgi:hypothetical protein
MRVREHTTTTRDVHVEIPKEEILDYLKEKGVLKGTLLPGACVWARIPDGLPLHIDTLVVDVLEETSTDWADAKPGR